MVSECVGGVIGNQGTRNQHSETDSGGRTACANLEYLAVELLGLLRLEGESEQDKRVREPLDPEADGAVAQVGFARSLDGVVVHVDDLVQIARGHASDGLQLVEVEEAVRRVEAPQLLLPHGV